MLIQNLVSLEIYCDGLRFQLDDLLMTNATQIGVNPAHLSGKDLNRYFKHWMALNSNSRMEHFSLIMSRDYYREDILKGLMAFELPEDQIGVFEPLINANFNAGRFHVAGRFQITRIDGTNGATVFMDTALDESLRIDFFVSS